MIRVVKNHTQLIQMACPNSVGHNHLPRHHFVTVVPCKEIAIEPNTATKCLSSAIIDWAIVIPLSRAKLLDTAVMTASGYMPQCRQRLKLGY
jgi:hypothetical protein